MLAALLGLAAAIQAEAPPPPVRAQSISGALATDDDYPPGAVRRREEGPVGFAVDVSPQGRVTRCDVMSSSGSRDLDLRTCQIMLVRARFRPARDAAGAPVADRVTGRIHWRLPGSGP